MMDETLVEIIRSPVVTEKAALFEESGKYIFKVAKSANKQQISSAIKQMFGVDVVAVNVINVAGKRKRLRSGRLYGKRASWRKAIVTLEDGQAISLQEIEEQS